jgi:arylsulfatase A-like enzyme
LDALAQQGVRFTQFYNTARCCPTRAALLTGLYSHQAGIGHMMDDRSASVGDAYSGELSKRAVTIAEALKSSGYATYMTGKWHVTKATNPKTDAEKHNWPLQRGFDRFYGTIHGAGSFYDPNSLVRDNELISPYNDSEYQPSEFYYTDAINDHATKFLVEHQKRSADKPFFLYMAHTAAHWPMHAKESDIAKYQGRYSAGYDAIRAARLAKMKKLGLLDPRWKIAPPSGDWDRVSNKEWEARCMEVFAAMLDCMDQGLGRLVDSLKKNGQYDNTLILFLQDNGGCAEGMGRNGPFVARSNSPTLPPLAKAYLQPDMIPKQTRDGYSVRQGAGVMPGPADTYIGYGQSWANVSNTPFREYKHWEHEGGISTPLIAHWPRGIPAARHGQLESQPSHIIDIMATCVDIAGAKYPNEVNGHTIQAIEGVSLVPALSGKSVQRSKPIFWEHEGNRAIRMVDWKLVSKHPGDWELYDIASDRTEMNNLVSQYPDRVREMSGLWGAWAARVGVAPWPLDGGAPKAVKKDKKNVKKKGELLFSDSFERTEMGEWKSIIPSFSVENGVLKGWQTRDDHGAVGRVYRPMKDVLVEFNFQLVGSTGFNVVFDDKDHKGSHAGHICRVAFAPKVVRLGDDKEGVMRNDIYEMRKTEARKAEADKLLIGRSLSSPATFEQKKWYRASIEIAGDQMLVSVDGVQLGSLKSPGIAHETKGSLHFTVNGPGVLFDDVKVWNTKK